jgi:hypothetical protein
MIRVMLAALLVLATAAGAAAGQQPSSGQSQSGTTAQPTGTGGTAADQAAQQQKTAGAVPEGATALGTVRITRKVTADGKPLAPGSYQVRLTPEEAKPEVAGQDEKLERWVEFRQGGQVKGREVVSIVPQAEIADVAEGTPPRPGGSKVELLKGNDYLRVWINRSGTHYLIHLPTGATAGTGT